MIIIKTKKQIEGIKKSCQLAAKTLKHIEQYVVEGITTLELNNICEKFIRDNGAEPAPLNYKGYPKATCISVNEVICHGIPSGYALKNGDIVNIDVTTILDGYFGDTSTMFSIGEIKPETKHLLNVAKKCLEIGIKQVRPGNRFGNIGYEINKYATSQKCSIVFQFCGHGVGVRFHEPPQVEHVAEKGSGPYMREGMIFTIEPMVCLASPEAVLLTDGWTAVTIDGGPSAQYEHSVLVTKHGYEILT